jgi:hypothetical protein
MRFLSEASLASAISECQLLALSDVTQALPQFEPWELKQGGAGGCRWEGEARAEDDSVSSVILAFTAQLPGDKQAAQELFEAVRSGFESSYVLQTVHSLGDKAFAYSALGDLRDWNYWILTDELVLSSQLMAPGEESLSADEIRAFERLNTKVLKQAQTPDVKASAQRCDYFEPALLAKLMPGKSTKVQQLGDNSCMAQNDRFDVLIVSVVDADADILDTLKASAAADCEVDTLENATGFVSYDCKSGNPSVSARFFHQSKMYEFSFVPSQRNPTEQERKALIALAQWNLNR